MKYLATIIAFAGIMGSVNLFGAEATKVASNDMKNARKEARQNCLKADPSLKEKHKELHECVKKALGK